MKVLSMILALLVWMPANGAEIVAIIIDSGLNVEKANAPLCKNGLLDFTKSGSTQDVSLKSHGTNIAGLITQNAGPKGYCIISIKVYDKGVGRMNFNGPAYIAALQHVLKLKPALLNISLAGPGSIGQEVELLKSILDGGTQIVVAAGNQSELLEPRNCNIYPACADSRIIVVGNSTNELSNFGPVVDVSIDGSDKTAGGVTLTGSSQAAAIFSGLTIRKALELQAKGFKDAQNYFKARIKVSPVPKIRDRRPIQRKAAN